MVEIADFRIRVKIIDCANPHQRAEIVSLFEQFIKETFSDKEENKLVVLSIREMLGLEEEVSS